MYYIYFLLSLKNNKVYVGCTEKDPKVRTEEHNEGSNVWTRTNRPFKLLYFEKYYCKKDALERERFYKMGFGKRIKKLIVEELCKIGA